MAADSGASDVDAALTGFQAALALAADATGQGAESTRQMAQQARADFIALDGRLAAKTSELGGRG